MASSQNINPAVSESREKLDEGVTGKRDNHSVTKRLQKDLLTLMTATDIDGVSAFPDGDDLFRWIGTIKGVESTVYEGLEYKLSFKFPSGYPYTAPTVKFETPCFHPNVDNSGNICLDILKEKWSALYDVRTVLLSIQSLLAEPNNNSPLNSYAAQLWENRSEYKKVLFDKYKTDVTDKK